MAELSDELGMHGFAGQIFQTLGTTVTAKLIGNIASAVTTNQPLNLFAGFDSGAFQVDILNVVGNVLGSTLAAQIVMPQTQGESIGASLGSSIGGFLGTGLSPVPGPRSFTAPLPG